MSDRKEGPIRAKKWEWQGPIEAKVFADRLEVLAAKEVASATERAVEMRRRAAELRANGWGEEDIR